MNNSEQTRGRRLSDDEILRAVPPTAKLREFRVGVFVILGIAGFFTFLYMMTDPGTFRGRYNLLTRVDDAQGVRNGDPVRIKGINIGSVAGAHIDGDDVLITLEIEGEWRIPTGSRAEMFSEGVLGGMVVSVLPGPGPGFIEPMGLIPGETSPDILTAAGGVANNVDYVLDRVRALLSDSLVAAVGEAVVHLRDIANDLSGLTAGRAEEVSAIMASLRRSAENVEGVTGAEEWKRTLATAETALASLDRTAGALGGTVTSLNTVVGRLERGEGTLGRLLVDESLYDELEATTRTLRELLADVKANPGRYLKIEIF